MRLLVFAIVAIVAIAAAACSRTVRQQDFASAEAAAQALVAAARSDDTRGLLEVLGPKASAVVDSGDPVQDKNSRERFLQSYEAAHQLHESPQGVTTLTVGPDDWPFPFPLVQRDGRWRFDSAAGVEEVINRRVGANELATIQSCLAYVDAQREYYVRNAQRDSLQHYAQQLVSSEGQKDGLYWPTLGDEPASPLGERFAQARSEGYFERGAVKGAPYHGYVYRLLTAQGPHAEGGAYDYIVRDKMLGGFALIAFPAEYGSTGVMTFIVSHDGVVFSKDLGPETPELAMDIAKFDPDDTWKREAVVD
jgi:hypothetical protein